MANFLAPPRLTALLWCFLLFRFFDIAKVFPINRLERLPGGAGIVLDDVMAGVYTLISLRLLLNGLGLINKLNLVRESNRKHKDNVEVKI